VHEVTQDRERTRGRVIVRQRNRVAHAETHAEMGRT
jgi:hypothetical protein